MSSKPHRFEAGHAVQGVPQHALRQRRLLRQPVPQRAVHRLPGLAVEGFPHLGGVGQGRRRDAVGRQRQLEVARHQRASARGPFGAECGGDGRLVDKHRIGPHDVVRGGLAAQFRDDGRMQRTGDRPRAEVLLDAEHLPGEGVPEVRPRQPPRQQRREEGPEPAVGFDETDLGRLEEAVGGHAVEHVRAEVRRAEVRAQRVPDRLREQRVVQRAEGIAGEQREALVGRQRGEVAGQGRGGVGGVGGRRNAPPVEQPGRLAGRQPAATHRRQLVRDEHQRTFHAEQVDVRVGEAVERNGLLAAERSVRGDPEGPPQHERR